MNDVSKPWQGSPPSAFKPKKPFMRLVRSHKPDHVIGERAVLQGRFEFNGLLRVEGRFEGVLKPAEGSNVMVARSGVIAGDVEGCQSVMVEGTVIGNVSANVVILRRHANIEGNVWCKDLAAAATAVFRNRATATAAPSSSSAFPHRRSNSSSTLNSGGEGSNPRRSSTARNKSYPTGITSTSKADGSRSVDDNTSLESSFCTDRPPASAMTVSSSGSLSRTAAAGGAEEQDSSNAAQPASMQDAISFAVGTVYPAGGGGGGGGCPFSGRMGNGVTSAGAAFALESSSSTQSSMAAVPSAQPPSRSVYNRKDAVVAPFVVGGEGGGGGSAEVANAGDKSGRHYHTNGGIGASAVVPAGPTSREGGGGESSDSCGWLPPPDPLPVVESLENSSYTGTTPQTPPPSVRRRRSRSGSGAGPEPCSRRNVDLYLDDAVAEPSPRTLRRAVFAGSTPGRLHAGSTPGRGLSSSVAAVSGGGGGGKRLATGGRWGCPHLENVSRPVEQEQRSAGLRKLAGNTAGRYGRADAAPKPGVHDYGLKSTSLTPGFAAVATMLRFDGDDNFDKHLQMEYAAENLWFWKEGMKYRSTAMENPERRRAEARRIYDAWLAVDSPNQVNISHNDREIVLAAVEKRQGAPSIGAGLFDEALMQVEDMMTLGPFPRFTRSTVQNIETSWKKVLESFGMADMGESFYSVLFEIDPSVERLFTRSKRVQGEMLTKIVDTSVHLLSNLAELVPVLIQLGLRHNAYKVRKEHFPIVGEALISTLGFILQDDFTEDIKRSWTAVYLLMSNIMTSVLIPHPDDDKENEASAQVGMSTDGTRTMYEISETTSGEKGEAPRTPSQRASRSASSSGAPSAAGAGGGRGVGGKGGGGDSVGSTASAKGRLPTAGKNAGGVGKAEKGGSRSVGSVTAGGSSIRGIYRRGTSSFRNHLSKLVRKESVHSLPASPSTTAELPSPPLGAAAALAASIAKGAAAAPSASAPAQTVTGSATCLSTTSTSTSSDFAVDGVTPGATTPATIEAAAASASTSSNVGASRAGDHRCAAITLPAKLATGADGGAVKRASLA